MFSHSLQTCSIVTFDASINFLLFQNIFCYNLYYKIFPGLMRKSLTDSKRLLSGF